VAPPPPRPTIRLDKWLFHARFVKSRSLAAALVEGAGVRVNGQRIAKPAYAVGPQDVLTFAIGARVRVVRVLDMANVAAPPPKRRRCMTTCPHRHRRPTCRALCLWRVDGLTKRHAVVLPHHTPNRLGRTRLNDPQGWIMSAVAVVQFA
jgi:ribosomal 50S subunit-recycling heat shock protein